MANILICDDEEAIKSLLQFQLESAGHHCISAEQGLEGFKKALHEKVDLIITDMMMPMWSGYDLAGALELIRNNIKIIVITGFSENELLEKVRSVSNVIGIFKKPWDKNELLSLIEEHGPETSSKNQSNL
jgi:CheY-like chemotaxis protein